MLDHPLIPVLRVVFTCQPVDELYTIPWSRRGVQKEHLVGIYCPEGNEYERYRYHCGTGPEVRVPLHIQ